MPARRVHFARFMVFALCSGAASAADTIPAANPAAVTDLAPASAPAQAGKDSSAVADPAVTQVAPSAGHDQAWYEQLIYASGATNGAAALCGAAQPDIDEHYKNAQRNLKKFAAEYDFSTSRFDQVFASGQANGRKMMTEMRGSGIDGCTGILQGFQSERVSTYEAMKKSVAEVADGLPDK